jgi:hypothetical protein
MSCFGVQNERIPSVTITDDATKRRGGRNTTTDILPDEGKEYRRGFFLVPIFDL